MREIIRWQLHRLFVDQVHFFLPFSRHQRKKRLLFISENDSLCDAQLFPFFFHAKDFQDIELRELPLQYFLSDRHPYKTHIDAICFQTWFNLPPKELEQLVQQIKVTWPDAQIAYLDWFAPTDLRYAECLDKYISAYLKKQVLIDFSQYNRPTRGDTNLNDYYANRFNLAEPEFFFKVPSDFQDKLFLGTHFAFSPRIMPYFLQPFPGDKERSIDLHSRISVSGSGWYRVMRQDAFDKLSSLEQHFKIACRGFVPKKQYLQELFSSKLCFSPFGYGEVCWRDFEAMMTGSLLLKPDMSHLDCYPNVFQPYQTYIPLSWDLSDLDEKVDYYLRHPDERETITRQAFQSMANYFQEQSFPQDSQPFLHRLKLV